MKALSEIPALPNQTIKPFQELAGIAEWSMLAVVAVFLIRQLVEADKVKRESDRNILNKLIDELCENKK